MDYAQGCDISKWNGIGNWNVSHDAGIRFSFIRAGHGELTKDFLMDAHVRGANAAGIPFGLYWYLWPWTQVKEQMTFFAKLVKDSGSTITPAIDVETTGGLDKMTMSVAIVTAIKALTDATGKYPIIYTRQSFFDSVTITHHVFSQCQLWVARWAVGLTSPWSDGKFKFRDWKEWLFWQYSGDNNAQAVKYGFPGPPQGDPDLDLNYFNGTTEDFEKWAGLPHELSLEDRVAALEKWRAEMEGK